MNFNKLKCALINNYSKDTAYALVRENWSINNRTLGQCAITSLIVNDYFGGEIKKCIVDGISHYFNEINNIIFDFTKEQFNHDINYNDSKSKTREEMLNNEDTKKRYKLLSSRVAEYIDKLNDIDSDILKCDLCPNLVERFTNNTSISYGNNTDILILGEAPANNGWRKSGKSWHDINLKMMKSGKILNNLLNIIDLELDGTTFLEAIKCFPKDRKHLKICNYNCKNHLSNQISLLNPKLIITLGDFATKAILDIKYKKFSDIVGVIQIIRINNKEVNVLPIYHPSPISPLGYKGNIPIFNSLKNNKILD